MPRALIRGMVECLRPRARQDDRRPRVRHGRVLPHGLRSPARAPQAEQGAEGVPEAQHVCRTRDRREHAAAVPDEHVSPQHRRNRRRESDPAHRCTHRRHGQTLRLRAGESAIRQNEQHVLFFDNQTAAKDPWTKEIWYYDYRTNVHHTLKRRPMRFEDLTEFIACYNAENRHARETQLRCGAPVAPARDVPRRCLRRGRFAGRPSCSLIPLGGRLGPRYSRGAVSRSLPRLQPRKQPHENRITPPNLPRH